MTIRRAGAPFGESLHGTFDEVVAWFSDELNEIHRLVRESDTNVAAFLGTEVDDAATALLVLRRVADDLWATLEYRQL
jgi:hypothetical protein